MPNPLMDEALKEAYANADTTEVVISTLELRHPAFTEPIRVVNDFVDIQALLETTAPENAGEVVTFRAFSFELTLPELTDEGIPELNIKLDNVSREITQHIELAIGVPEKLEVIYRAYLASDLTTAGPHNNPPLHLTITSIEATALSVDVTASLVDFVNKKFPTEEYDGNRFPGLLAS